MLSADRRHCSGTCPRARTH